MRLHRLVPALYVIASLASPLVGADQDPVRVRTVVLFSSGVGYFEHAGVVDGAATCELRVKTTQLNDLLKSLLLDDQDGGHPGAIEYPSLDPIAKTLASFQVDIGGNPSLGDLLGQLRGAVVSLVTGDQTLSGTILGLEKRTVSVGEHGDHTMEVCVLDLLADGSVRQIRLDEVRSLTFTDPKLQEELTKALSALSQARDQDKKPVVIHFEGTGKRHVSLAYVVETPVWKTSYRLVMPPMVKNGDHPAPGPAKGTMQGWAIVENQTDSDWQDVHLKLVSGRPISFIEDLSQPLYVPRPVVQPELYASLTPQTYDGGLVENGEVTAKARKDGINGPGDAKAMEELASDVAAAPAAAPMAGGTMRQQSLPMNAVRSIQVAAHADTLGQLFSYTVDKVALARQRSAMLPIINDAIQVERVSIYNRSVLPGHPLNGALLTNTTTNLLPQGPVTVLDGSGYAGDASLDNLPQGDHRLISYAIDLPVKADSTSDANDRQVVSAKIVQGVLQLSVRLVASVIYHFDSTDTLDQNLVVEHAFRQGWSLSDTPEPFERTPQLCRWRVLLPAGKAVAFPVHEQYVQAEAYGITSLDDSTIVTYIKDGAISQPVKDALAKAQAMRREVAEVQHQIEARQQDLARISQDQTRLRENMRTVNDRTTQYYQRLLAKLSDQENQVEAAQKSCDELHVTLDQKQKALNDYIAQVSIP